MTALFVTVHLLAAGIWFGGSTALVFVGVPAIRTLDGEPRGRAMKELGLRWRPIGYGALARRGADRRRARRARLAVDDVVRGRARGEGSGRSCALLVVSYLHNFVYGPRVQAEVRAGGDQPTRPDARRRRLDQLLAHAHAADSRRRVAR